MISHSNEPMAKEESMEGARPVVIAGGQGADKYARIVEGFQG
jgi:hypothetical protein